MMQYLGELFLAFVMILGLRGVAHTAIHPERFKDRTDLGEAVLFSSFMLAIGFVYFWRH